MQQVAQTTDVLPVLEIVESSALPFALLPHQFDAFISQHADFASACQWGFEWYCEDTGEFGDIATFYDVQSFLAFEVRRRYDHVDAYFGVLSLPRRAGYCLGWLSGLARVHRDLALLGLDLLSSLVSCQYQEEIRRGFNPLVDIPGLHGCSLAQ